ncbi:hypothetical protein BgiMline_018826 [Biomphalaria glabrata]|nr:hypothetical protein BgiMline_006419 [Biomphalaria glabrata]KAI8791276.1 hypothetical protein BgiBS90_006740 [Biomphalaria glabrata]
MLFQNFIEIRVSDNNWHLSQHLSLRQRVLQARSLSWRHIKETKNNYTAQIFSNLSPTKCPNKRLLQKECFDSFLS